MGSVAPTTPAPTKEPTLAPTYSEYCYVTSYSSTVSGFKMDCDPTCGTCDATVSSITLETCADKTTTSTGYTGDVYVTDYGPMSDFPSPMPTTAAPVPPPTVSAAPTPRPTTTVVSAGMSTIPSVVVATASVVAATALAF